MNVLSFGFILTGVLLNAGAQLLLKAGTNSVGEFAFSRENLFPIGWRLASEPHIVAGLACTSSALPFGFLRSRASK